MSQIVECADGVDIDLGSALVVGPALSRLEKMVGPTVLMNTLLTTYTNEIVPKVVWDAAREEAQALLPQLAHDQELAEILRTFIGGGY